MAKQNMCGNGRIFPTDKLRCFWCKEVKQLTNDHFIPVAHGGTRMDGLIKACGTCNNARGDAPFLAYLHIVIEEHFMCYLEGRSYKSPKYIHIDEPTKNSRGNIGWYVTRDSKAVRRGKVKRGEIKLQPFLRKN